MSETPQHTPAEAAASSRYSATDLVNFAGADELAAGAAVAGEPGRHLRARLLADELAAGHCVMMRLAARTDYAMTNAAGLGGDDALAFDLVAARFAGTAARLMDQYRRGLLSLRRLDRAGDEEEGEWVGVCFDGEAKAAPAELERRLARAKAARAAGLAADREDAPLSPEERAAVDAADAVARRLVVEARADNLGVAGAADRACLFLDQLSAGHRMAMRLAGRTDRQIDRLGAPAANDASTRRAVLRLSSAMARLMERVRLGFVALDRSPSPSPSDPNGGPRKVAGYYWTGKHDMLAGHAIDAPANDIGGQKTEARGQKASRPDAEAPPPGPGLPAGTFRPPNRGRLKNGNPSGDYLTAPRCGARTRAGCACRQPAMANGRCRFHGGKSTGPRTEAGLARSRRARLTHGFRSAEVIDLRKAAAATARRLRTLLAGAPPAGHGLHRHNSGVVAGCGPAIIPLCSGRGELDRQGASFDKLRIRENGCSTKTLPHPELVEGRRKNARENRREESLRRCNPDIHLRSSAVNDC